MYRHMSLIVIAYNKWRTDNKCNYLPFSYDNGITFTSYQYSLCHNVKENKLTFNHYLLIRHEYHEYHNLNAALEIFQ